MAISLQKCDKCHKISPTRYWDNVRKIWVCEECSTYFKK